MARRRAGPTLNLSSCAPALDTFRQRFYDEGLPETLSAQAFAAFERGRYTRAELAQGRADWELRALDEYRSQVAFTEFLAELTDAGFAFDVLSTGVRVVRDEARHVELCRRMVVALGGSDVVPGEPGWVRSDPGLPLRERVLLTTVNSLCIGETLSVALLAAVRANTRDPLCKAVLTALVADESIHSRFGWELLEVWAPALPARARRRAEAQLPEVLAAVERQVVQPEGEPDHGGPFGTLSTARRNAVFARAMARDVVARFERLGFHAERAWARRPR